MAAVTELANKTPPGQLHETGQSLMRVNRPPYLHACPIAPVRLVPAIRGAMTQRQVSNLSGHSALHLKSSLPRRPAVQNGDYASLWSRTVPPQPTRYRQGRITGV